MKRPGVIPYSCYAQFRDQTVTAKKVDATWRECAILGNEVRMSVMPLLTDELTFVSFAEHQRLWNALGCIVAVRESSLSELAERHERTVEKEFSAKRLRDKLDRAKRLENMEGVQLVRFDGAMQQARYRDALVEMIRSMSDESIAGPAKECLAEIHSSPYDILDLARALEIIDQYPLDARFGAAAHLAYYENGRELFDGIPLVPAQHAIAIPRSREDDLLAALVQAAHTEVLNNSQLQEGALAEVQIDKFVPFAKSSAARNFCRWLQLTIASIDVSNLSDEEATRRIREEVADRFLRERRARTIFGFYGALGNLAGLFFDWVGYLQIGINAVNKVTGPTLGSTVLLTYTQKVQALAQQGYSASVAGRS